MRYEPREFELGGARSSFPPSPKKLASWWHVSKQIAAVVLAASSFATPVGLWFWDEYKKLLAADSLAVKHDDDRKNEVANLTREWKLERLRERMAVAVAYRTILEHEVASMKLPVKPVLEDYEHLVGAWAEALDKCELLPESCDTPEVAFGKALSQARPARR